MTYRATISNATFDAAAALVPLPFGPLTRVTNLETEPFVFPNSHIRVSVTGAGSVAFQISYDEMTNAGSLQDVLREAYPTQSLVLDLQTFASLLYNAAITNITLLTATPAQYKAAMDLFMYFRPASMLMPVFSYEEEARRNKALANFTGTPAGANLTVVNTSVGYEITDYEWDWGDSTKSYVAAPAPHTYAVDGTYVVTLKIGGRGGFSQIRKSFTINVP